MVPVVDISEHQGVVDFGKMRDRGVQGLILRATHGQTADSRARIYYPLALAAGFAPWDVGWYSFINPKRGTAVQCANATAALIEDIAGRASFVMIDAESYQDEPPNRGTAPVAGPAYSRYCEEFADIVRARLRCPVIAYSNAAFWNSFVKDTSWTPTVEWIVPRYPAYSLASYGRRPLPADASGWEAWANSTGAIPNPPAGVAQWAGWQFSAGHNRQGPVYGCQSSDLDLNIVRPDAWQRWTRQPAAVTPIPIDPEPAVEDAVTHLIFKSETLGEAHVMIGEGMFKMVGFTTVDDRDAIVRHFKPEVVSMSDGQYGAYASASG